jgi:hypothetical protein
VKGLGVENWDQSAPGCSPRGLGLAEPFFFFQNNNDEDPNCAGIEGVLESYFQSLRTVQLYGPTYFAPVINQVAR